jgi:argininosuccinate synthase
VIAVLPEGGAETICVTREEPDHDELLDHAAMEFGTD